MQPNTKQIQEDIFRATPRHLIADIIASNYPDARITDKLIESYMDLSLTRQFTTDKTISEIRRLNSFDADFEDKLTFILDDDSKVIVSEETYQHICECINSNDTIQFMRKNKENFLNCVNIIQEDTDEK